MTGIRIGLEVLSAHPPAEVRERRLGLLMNQASVDQHMRYACDVIAEACPGQLKRLFSPQHGFWGEQQANMIESPDSRYEQLDLPIHSLYADKRRPEAEHLRDLDVLVIDLQDVGCRVYTFIWTVVECLRACAEVGVSAVICDRPNPLGGLVTEGPVVQPGYESFVGGAAIPMRHALTIGELASLLNQELQIGATLSVLPMQGWRREMLWPQTGRLWIPPSPNMPRWQTAMVYPGQVLLEGTTISEGRGTTRPFEFCGLPGISEDQLLRRMPAVCCAGLQLQPIRFRPTFDKWRGTTCHGLSLHIQAPAKIRSFGFTVSLLAVLAQHFPDSFQFTPPPYEYEYMRPPIDILWGSSALREAFAATGDLNAGDIAELIQHDEGHWNQRVASILRPEYSG